MKRLLLIGDSIRIGYQDYLKEELVGLYDVVYWEDNSRFVHYAYWQLNQMFKNHGPFDVVYFNSGYWDMNIEAPMKSHLVPIKEYKKYLQLIVAFIREQDAVPVFGNTVPIYNEGGSVDNTGTGVKINYNNDWVTKYNQEAEALMKELDVEIIDLYSEMLKGPKYYKCEDMLHLSEQGSRICAKTIAKALTK